MIGRWVRWQEERKGEWERKRERTDGLTDLLSMVHSRGLAQIWPTIINEPSLKNNLWSTVTKNAMTLYPLLPMNEPGLPIARFRADDPPISRISWYNYYHILSNLNHDPIQSQPWTLRPKNHGWHWLREVHQMNRIEISPPLRFTFGNHHPPLNSLPRSPREKPRRSQVSASRGEFVDHMHI